MSNRTAPGVKNGRPALRRHVLVAGFAGLAVYAGWLIHSTWDTEMRLWKSFAVAAFVLLWFAASIGPASRIWRPLGRAVAWRRQFGIWFALVALVHGYLVIDGWGEWSIRQLLGYQFAPQLDLWLRFEPGFGLANLMGLVALFFALVLAASSSDRAVDFVGASSWKWLHGFTYVIFYVVALHSTYYAFIHYTPSPHRLMMGMQVIYPPNPLRFVYLAMVLSVFLAQAAAFMKTVSQRR